MQIQSLGCEDPLQKEMATQSTILAWEIPWTEEHGGLQSTGLQKSWHNWQLNTNNKTTTGFSFKSLSGVDAEHDNTGTFQSFKF